ncbi:MAG TPA: hypothetical protein VGG19_05920 [Tepidisphaeraceae bacterium]|jgi:hypothetical protein
MNMVLWKKSTGRRRDRAKRARGCAHAIHCLHSAVETLENRLLLSNSYLVNNDELFINGVDSGAVGSSISDGTAGDTFEVENSTLSSTLTITGSGSGASFVVLGSSGHISIVAGNSANNINFQGFSGTSTINGGGGADTISDTSGGGNAMTVQGGNGLDTISFRDPSTGVESMDVNVATSVLTNGSDTLNYSAETPSAVSLVGQISGGDAILTVDATSGADTVNLSNTNITFGNPAVKPTYGYSNFNSLVINGNGGNDTFNVNSDIYTTTIYDGNSGTSGSGTDNFNVITNNVPLTLVGGSHIDNYSITSNSGPLTINGGTGTNGLTIHSASSTINFNSGAGSTNTYTIVANDSFLTLTEGSSAVNNLVVDANSGTISVTGSASGTDDNRILSTSGGITLNGGTGSTTYEVVGPPGSAITINGNAAAPEGLLTFTGTTIGDAFSLSYNSGTLQSTLSAGSGNPIYFSSLTGVVIDDSASHSANTFLVQSNITPTTINGGAGNDTFNIEATAAAGTLSLNGNGGTNTVNLGSVAPAMTGNTLANILGNITFVGNSANTDILNYDDDADNTSQTFTLTSTTIASTITSAVITYSGLAQLNLNFDNDGNTLYVASTAQHATTTTNLGTDVNFVVIGSNVPSTTGGSLDGMLGPIDLVGSDSDALTIDDSGAAAARTMTLDATTLTSAGLGAITYGGFSSLTVNLSSVSLENNIFNITTTNSTTPTTINGGTQNDTYNITNDASALTVNTGAGTDTVNILATDATTDINTQGGGTTIDNIGSLAPTETGGVISGIQGAITLAGGVDDTVFIDDSADATANQTGTLTASKLTGLGMVAAGITYSGLYNLTINLGANGNTFTVSDTSAVTGTNINGGAGADNITVTTNTDPLIISTVGGNDTVTVTNTASALNIASGTGNDTVTIDDAGAPVTVTGGGGADVTNVLSDAFASGITIDDSVDAGDSVDISSNAPSAGNLAGIAQDVSVTGSGTTTLTIDDSTDTSVTTATLSDTSLTFSTGGSSAPISFSNLATLDLNLGSGGNSLVVSNTSATTATNISPGTGSNSIQIAATAAGCPLNITSTGTDTILAGSTSTVGSGVMTAIQAKITVTGNNSDILELDDGGDNTVQNVDLYSNKYVNSGGNWAEVDFTGLSSLSLWLGNGNDAATIVDTPANANTNFKLGSGTDTITLRADSGPTTISTGDGSDEIYVLTTDAQTTILCNTSATVHVGTDAPNADSNLDSINGKLIITGTLGYLNLGSTVDLLDNISNNAKPNIVWNGNAITGLAPAEIDISSIFLVSVSLGNAPDTVALEGPSGAGITQIASSGTAGVADTFNVQSLAHAVTITAGAGNDVVNVTSTAPTPGGNVAGITGTLTIDGDAGTTLNVDNSGATDGETDTITSSEITLGANSVDYSDVPIVNVELSQGDDVLTISSTEGLATAAVYSINTEGGSDEVQVEGLSDDLTLDTGNDTNGSDTIFIGSNGDAGGGVVSSIADPVTVMGHGSDSLTIDDSGDSSATTTDLTATTISTLLSTVTYSDLGDLTFDLSSGGNTFNATGTATGTLTTVNTGTGANITNIGSLAPAISGGNLGNINGEISITGQGTDTLNIDDSGSATSDMGGMNTAEVFLAPATIDYAVNNLNIYLSDLGTNFSVGDTALLTSTILYGGPAADYFSISDESSPVTINTGMGNDTVFVLGGDDSLNLINSGGTDTFNIGDSADGTAHQDISGAISIMGAGSDDLIMDDAGDTVGRNVTLSDTEQTGAWAATVDYSSLASLSLSLGSGNDTLVIPTTINGNTAVNTGNGNDSVDLLANSAATSITTGSGTDVVNISSTAPTAGGNLNGIIAAVSVTGGGSTTLNLDDSGSTHAQSPIFTAGLVTLLASGNISYAGLSNLNVKLGSGVQSVTVESTLANADTVITAGSANDTFTLQGTVNTSLAAGLAGPITVDGNLGTNALTVDDSTDAAAADAVLTPTTITGIGSTITYLNFSSLAMTLGSGGNLTINGTNPNTTTTVGGGGSGGYQANLNYPGGFTGTVTLSNVTGGTITITGDLAGAMSLSGNLDALDVTGDLSGMFSLSGNLGGGTLGNLSGSLLVGGTIGTLTINANLTGTLTAGGDVTALDVVEDLSGTFSSGGTVGTLTVGDDLDGRAAITDDLTTATLGSIFGTLDVGGNIGSLTINGQDAGTITAGTVGTIALPHATITGAGDNLFDLTQDGVYRAIRAIPDSNANLSGLTANIFYEGNYASVIPFDAGAADSVLSLTPEVGIVLTNTNASQMFDLVLSSSGVSSFDLDYLHSTSNAKTGLFNLAINGSLLTTADAATGQYFGLVHPAIAADIPASLTYTGGVFLPNDHLGLISVSENLPSNSVTVSSIQGLAFSSFTMPNGQTMLAQSSWVYPNQLFNVFTVTGKNNKPTGEVVPPGSQPLRVMVSPASSTPVGVFTGLAKKGTLISSNALYFTDQNSDSAGNLMADVTFAAKTRSHGHKVVSDITFQGDGGAVNTWSVVNNIHSDGWLGDVLLEGGYAKLQSITAPSIHGNINLFGGKLTGQIQTTGEEIDPITGAITSVSGDLGTATSGGVDADSLATFAASAQGNSGNDSTIEHVAMMKGSSIVVRGNLVSRTTIDGSLLGNIAVSGDIDGDINVLGDGGSPGDIIALGNINGDITINGTLTGRIAAKGNIAGKIGIQNNISKTGGVIASGQIGSTASGNKVIDDTQQGLLVAGGSLAYTNRHGAAKTAETIANANSKTANASQLANLWTSSGNSLGLDTSGTLDEAGLRAILKDVTALKASGGTLSGTTA